MTTLECNNLGGDVRSTFGKEQVQFHLYKSRSFPKRAEPYRSEGEEGYTSRRYCLEERS